MQLKLECVTHFTIIIIMNAIKVRVRDTLFSVHYHDSENVCVSQTNKNLRESECLMLKFFYYKD